MSNQEKDPFRALFRVKSYFEAIPLAWDRACSNGASESAAVSTLLTALNAHARRPTLDDIASFTAHEVPRYDLLASLAVVFACWKWYRDNPKAIALATIAAFPAVESADMDANERRPLRVEIFRLGYAIHMHHPMNEENQAVRRMFRTMLGTSLAPADDPVVGAEGRALLQKHLADLRQAVAAAERIGGDTDSLFDLRAELAKAMANVGQSLQSFAERHDCDDPEACLEQALVLHNEAMAFPERVADASSPLGLYHSLRMRGTCQRLLAMRFSHGERRLELLEGAVADARAARTLYQRVPSRFPDGALIVVNLVNAMKDHLAVRVGLGRTSTDEARREIVSLRLIAREARSDRGSQIGPSLLAQMETGLGHLEETLGLRARKPDYAALTRHVMAALATMPDMQVDPIDPVAAKAVVQQLEFLPADEQLPAPLMNLLGGFFAGLHVDILGPELSVRAMQQEFRLLCVETGEHREILPGHPERWDPIRYVSDGILGFRRRMGNPTWSYAEKRISAGWLALLARARLLWAVRGVRPISHLEGLWLTDLCGSTSWRSDLSFYGQGPTRYDTGPMRTAPEWRLFLYRTRFERDMNAEFLQAVELGELVGHMTGQPVSTIHNEEYRRGAEIFPKGTSHDAIRAKTSTPEHLWLESPDGITVPYLMSEGEARSHSTTLLAELRMAVSTMVQAGWMAGDFPDVPEATPEHLREWLANNRTTAIVSVGDALVPSVIAHDQTEVWHAELDAPQNIATLLAEYEHARDEHSFGSYEAGASVLAPGLTEEEREAQYRMVVATPKATERLDRAVRDLLSALGQVFASPLQNALQRGIQRLVILPRGWARHVPWFAVPVGHQILGDLFANAVVETLAPVPRSPPRRERSVLYVGGQAKQNSSLSLGKAILSRLSDRTDGPMDRDAFEMLAATCNVLRVFAHGTAMQLRTDAGGIEMNEDDQRAINRYSISEARTLDLRGARRVELWACESSRSDALYSKLVHHDEPAGLDAAVLLAGAECAIGSLWTQYVLSSAMLAEAFTLELAARPQSEAAALSSSVRRYRDGMSTTGCFTDAVCAYVTKAPRPSRVESALRAGLDAWRRLAWSELRDREAPPLPPNVALDGLRLGPSRSTPRTCIGTTLELVDQILAPYRSPLAWAGWRVTLRSKEAFDPRPNTENGQ